MIFGISVVLLFLLFDILFCLFRSSLFFCESGWRFANFVYLIEKSLFSFFNKFIYLFMFIFGCVGSSFLCGGFLQLRRAGATLHRGARASHRRGLSCCGAQAPDAQAQ